MLGHELRNPLAPILTALQLMRLRSVTGAERERTIIERQVNHLVSLVDDLLDVSRITRGKVQLRRERVDLAEVVAKAIEMTEPAIEERRHALHVDVPRGADGERRCRAARAGRRQPADQRREVHRRRRRDPRQRPCRDRRDVGDRGDRQRARHRPPRCCRASSTCSRRSARKSTARQAGSASASPSSRAWCRRTAAPSARTATGRGAARSSPCACPSPVTRPARSRAAEPRRAAKAPAPERHQVCAILVVDDNADAARDAGRMPARPRAQPRIALDGPTALHRCGQLQPEVVLLDLGLPVMDGFEVAQRLRDQQADRGPSNSSPLPATVRKSTASAARPRASTSTW